MPTADGLEHTGNLISWTLALVGYFFLYLGIGIGFVLRFAHTVMSVTADSLANSWWRHPFLFMFTVLAGIATCLVASWVCLRGTLRAIIPLLSLALASALTIGVSLGLSRMWERAG